MNYYLSFLVHHRFRSLDRIRETIERATGRKIHAIAESQTEPFEGGDFMIDYEFEDRVGDVLTMFYLKDNANNYYITEV